MFGITPSTKKIRGQTLIEKYIAGFASDFG